MPSGSSFGEDDVVRYLLPQGVGDTEEVERYQPGGFHPVHLGDRYDGERYKIIHKLGAGGFSTVWLARDRCDNEWVALKIVEAEHSVSIAEKTVVSNTILKGGEEERAATHIRKFSFDGPNGHHLCLVLPVLGPSLSELSYCFNSRLTPSLARRAGYQATRAVADLHSRGLCHGDITTGNLLLGSLDIESYDENGIYRLFGKPVTGVLESESGETPGLEAPRYIVKSIDFLSAPTNIIKQEVKLIDFDQSFPISSPPQTMLGIPADCLAPEVAVGLRASPASDVWALGCCLFRLRSVDGPFSSPFEVNSPADLVSYAIHTLGQDVLHEWLEDTFWDSRGRPTKDTEKGDSFIPWEGKERSLREIVYNIWDEPEGRVVRTASPTPQRRVGLESDDKPFHPSWSDMAWNTKAIKVDNNYLSGYDDEWDKVFEALPKIPADEAALLYDLLSKIFVYDPAERPTARETLVHPWFHMDEAKE